jgi:predicted transposase
VSIRTIDLSLRPTPQQESLFCDLRTAFAAACNYTSAVAWEHQEFRRTELQDLVYPELRGRFGLMAQHAVRAVAVVVHSYKVERSHQHTFRPDGAVVLDTPRQYRVRGNQASISTLPGRIDVQLNIGGVQRRQLAAAEKLLKPTSCATTKGGGAC